VRLFFADLRRTVLSPASIATLLVAVLLAVLLSVPSEPPTGPFGPMGFSVAYEYNQGFVFHFFVFNQSGQPTSGVETRVTEQSGGNFSPGPPVTAEATTGSDGMASVTLPGNDTSTSVSLDVRSPSGEEGFSGFSVNAAPPGTVVLGPGALSLIDAGRYGLTPKLLLFDPGPGGSSPAGATVVIRANYTTPTPKDVLLASSPVLASVSAYSIPGSELPLLANDIEVDVLGPGGAQLAQWNGLPSELAVLPYTATGWGGSLNERAMLWGFLAPVLAVGFGYAAYARPRSSRALEPVLALPTTRLGVLVRRFVSALIPLAAGTGLAVLTEFQVSGPLSTGLSPALLATIWGALLLEGIAFLALVVLLAHLLRSAAAVAALCIAFAAFLAFFIPAAIYLFDDALGHTPSPTVLSGEMLWNPTFLPSAGIASYFGGLGSPGVPSLLLPPPGQVFATVATLTAAFTLGAVLFAAWFATQRD
jgi:hypothetical protein